MLVLNPVEARVMGSLMEKEITTPEYYPLSLNALVNACNQKSSRDPVLELGEGDVRTALFELEGRGLVRVLAEARVPKYEHRLRDPLQLRRDEVAVVCLLLLRGAQTAGELRARADRLYSFEGTLAVQATLERLASRSEPVVRLLPRQPGAREARWRHLLDGTQGDGAQGGGSVHPVRAGHEPGVEPGTEPDAYPVPSNSDLHERVAALEGQIAALTERMQRLAAAFGVD